MGQNSKILQTFFALETLKSKKILNPPLLCLGENVHQLFIYLHFFPLYEILLKHSDAYLNQNMLGLFSKINTITTDFSCIFLLLKIKKISVPLTSSLDLNLWPSTSSIILRAKNLEVKHKKNYGRTFLRNLFFFSF